MSSGILDKANLIQEVAELVMKGTKETDIAKMKGISVSSVRSYLNEWEEYVKDKAITNPELFDRVLENSIKFMETFDLMIKNAWEVHDEAKESSVSATRLSALKVIHELTAQKARLFQLLGPKQDTSYLEKTKRAERVNEVLSEILRNTVSDCIRCRPLVWDQLQEAFNMMNDDRGLPSP